MQPNPSQFVPNGRKEQHSSLSSNSLDAPQRGTSDPPKDPSNLQNLQRHQTYHLETSTTHSLTLSDTAVPPKQPEKEGKQQKEPVSLVLTLQIQSNSLTAQTQTRTGTISYKTKPFEKVFGGTPGDIITESPSNKERESGVLGSLKHKFTKKNKTNTSTSHLAETTKSKTVSGTPQLTNGACLAYVLGKLCCCFVSSRPQSLPSQKKESRELPPFSQTSKENKLSAPEKKKSYEDGSYTGFIFHEEPSCKSESEELSLGKIGNTVICGVTPLPEKENDSLETPKEEKIKKIKQPVSRLSPLPEISTLQKETEQRGA